MYNAQTDGIKVADSASYPGDKLITSGFHMAITELSATGLLEVTQSATAPGSPSLNQLWYKPDTGLATSSEPEGDGALYRWNGASWMPMTPLQFARYVTHLADLKALPANAAGWLRNDGSGNLSWDANALSTLEMVDASGNITLNGNYDCIDISLSGNIVLNALSNFPKNKPMLVRLRQPADTPRTISLNTTVIKKGAIDFTVSTDTNAIDILGLVCRAENAIAEVCMFNRGVE